MNPAESHHCLEPLEEALAESGSALQVVRTEQGEVRAARPRARAPARARARPPTRARARAFYIYQLPIDRLRLLC